MPSTFIPGADIIGQSFNPFAPGSTSLNGSTLGALRGSIFNFGGGNTLEVPWEGKPSKDAKGDCPDGVDMITSFHSGMGQVVVCNSDMDLSNAVSASVGVSGTYGMFRGSAEASFARTTCVSSSYYYCMVESSVSQYQLQLSNDLITGPGQVGKTLLSNTFLTALAELPTSFDPTDANCCSQFQQFFTLYGTHLIAGVGMGSVGRLVVAIERSFSSQTDNASADVNADYEGMVSGSAQSAIQFSDTSYLQNSQRLFVAQGGDPTLAANLGINPYDGNYGAWLKSVDATNVAAVSVNLIGLWQLSAADACSTAMQQAYNYLTMPALAIPVYLYQESDQKDFFYTAFESTSGGSSAPTQDPIGKSYTFGGIAFYSVPQGLSPTLVGTTKMHRYFNGSNHVYTIDPAAEGLEGYTEQADMYLMVFEPGAQAPNIGGLYRWFCASKAHWYATDSNDAPPPYKKEAAKFEGLCAQVFQSGQFDPFSDSVKAAQGRP
ncbi:MAC/perforin domain-containing protein [Variovorax sp. LjRoot178]|uniref:MAC/perforin domain-containing protein n=1 Tax=Variovorax sp. LjRoot178 TaxID=3342277 RepID=UPI003ECC2A72